jgi:ATP-binding cassette subfamily C protein CydD
VNLDPRLLKWARLAWPKLVATTSAGYGGAVLGIILAWQVSFIVAGVFLSGWSLANAMPTLWIMLILIISRVFFNWIAESIGAAAAVQVKSRLRMELLERFFQLGPAYTQAQNSGDLAVTVLHGLEGLDAWYSRYLPQIILAACVPLTILVVVFPLDILSGLVFLLTGPLIPLFMILRDWLR